VHFFSQVSFALKIDLQFKRLLFQNLLHLCQVKQCWSQNLLSLLVHFHQAPHQILDLKIDHLPGLRIRLKPHHLRHLQNHLRHLQIRLKPHHLNLDLQNPLHQLVQGKLVPQTQQFDLLLKQDQVKFFLIQNFMQFSFLN